MSIVLVQTHATDPVVPSVPGQRDVAATDLGLFGGCNGGKHADR